MPKVKLNYEKKIPNPSLNFRNSWKLSIKTVQGSHLIFTYNCITQLVSTHTLDKDGHKLLELEDMTIDRFNIYYNKLVVKSFKFI